MSVGSLCWGLQGTGTAGLSPELWHQTPTTEPLSQKLCRGRARALSMSWEGEDKQKDNLHPKPKSQQT